MTGAFCARLRNMRVLRVRNMIEHVFDDGIVILGDATDIAMRDYVLGLAGQTPLIVCDPPYGNIVKEKWDKAESEDKFTDWMLNWVSLWAPVLLPQAAMYLWGGVGKPGFRPFFRFLADIEKDGELSLANLITWKKKRAYGVQNNYLFCREECAYLCKGDQKHPRCFNIPLLEKLRGYAGYNPDHPAKSEYLRRSNVWDESEVFRDKWHVCQKADRVSEIPIEVHTQPGEIVIDLFAGSASTCVAARKLGRQFIAIENDPEEYANILKRLGA